MARWVIALLALACAHGCSKPDPKPSTRPVSLVFSGDTAGWLRPCGCASNQSGGLARRATYVTQLRQSADVIYVDVGGAPSGTSAYERVKFEAILEGERATGIAVHNIGRAEAALGAEYLREVQTRSKVRFISCNLRDSGGELVAMTKSIEKAGGQRIMFVGVISPRCCPPTMRADDPRTAILATIGPAKGSYDVLVVLAYLPDEELTELASSLPEADVVMGGPTGQNLKPRRVGPVLLASATNMGKFPVQIDIAPGSARESWEAMAVEMNASFADHPAVVEIIASHMRQLEQNDFPANQTGLSEYTAAFPPGYGLAALDSCISCHTAEHEIWLAGRHAKAWETLRAKGSHVDPSCQKCHTTSYGASGGFISRKQTPLLVNVTCQDCHGPSLAHAEGRRKGMANAAPTAYAAQAGSRCIRCHDHENSPEFAYESYWKLIRHGKGARPETRPSTQSAGAEVHR